MDAGAGGQVGNWLMHAHGYRHGEQPCSVLSLLDMLLAVRRQTDGHFLPIKRDASFLYCTVAYGMTPVSRVVGNG